MESKKILVTGGSGFLGSHIVDALSKAGQKPVIFDKIASDFRKPNQKMFTGDILSPKHLMNAMKGVDTVFHLAALADINITWNNPRETMKVNVLGTTNVLEAARLNGVKKFIFASTLYADSHTGGLYRVSKHTGENLVKTYYDYCGLKYIILRFGTLYGPRSKDNNSIKGLLKQALTGKIIYKGTGEEVREYIHVSDAANICLKLLDDKYDLSTLLLTGYHRWKLTEVLDMIKEIFKNKLEVIYDKADDRSHYKIVPYAYTLDKPRRIVPETYCDLGASFIEILEEIGGDK